jgi:arylsulfatase A-like enzyme
MMTGYLPTTVLSDGEVPRIEPWAVTLAEYLRARGYGTAAFSDDGQLPAASGFARGFDVYEATVGAISTREADPVPAPNAERVFKRGLDWLGAEAREPVFLFLHTDQVHSPYEAPADPANEFSVAADAPAPVREAADYDREIRATDAALGRLLDALDADASFKDALVILTSDHGEEFGEHGRRCHGHDLYDETLRIPLIIRAPGLLPPAVRRTGPMSLTDVPRTVGALLGFELPEEVEGHDFVAHLRDDVVPDPVAIYHEATAEKAATYDGDDPSWLAPSFAVTSWPRRLSRIRTSEGARYEMYDLLDDPAEKTDVYPKRIKQIGFLRARLDRYQEFRTRRRAELAQAAARSDRAAAEPDGDEPAALDAE